MILFGSKVDTELLALRSAWEAGVTVPYPVEQTELGLMMEFIGDEEGAAPKLAQARLSDDELASAVMRPSATFNDTLASLT